MLICKVPDVWIGALCESYRIGSITAIEVGPGQKVQNLHRDNCIYPLSLPGMEMLIGCVWALTDFTEENGATRIILGSHRHINVGEEIDVSHVEQAVMPKSPVLFYQGSTMHGARENRSEEARMGLINSYSLVWLRQEANQYLSVQLELARNFDERVRRLLGYTTHDRLGDRLDKYYGSVTSFI